MEFIPLPGNGYELGHTDTEANISAQIRRVYEQFLLPFDQQYLYHLHLWQQDEAREQLNPVGTPQENVPHAQSAQMHSVWPTQSQLQFATRLVGLLRTRLSSA